MNAWKKWMRVVVLLSALVIAGGCSTTTPTEPGEPTSETPGPTATAEPSEAAAPTLAPTPVLETAADFVPGENALEDGAYLFIERWSDITGSSDCEVTLHIDEPMYDYACDGPCDWRWGPGIPDKPIARLENYGYQGDEQEAGQLFGFLGLGSSISRVGGGVASGLEGISALPFEIPYSEPAMSLQSVLADGSVVVAIDGGAYLLAPGQSWVQREYADRQWLVSMYQSEKNIPDGCSVVLTDRLSNFGLIQRDQLWGWRP